jgi:formylglycine-generating enzyme required for sulfatase activity
MSVTTLTVHIVDDDASFLAAASRLLQASGFAVKTFSSAADFLAQRDTDAPGCVVADLQMPEMNGLDLQSALASDSQSAADSFPHRPRRHPLVRARDTRWCGGFPGKERAERTAAEAEWEYAARGGLESKRYVWGNEFRPGGRYMANTWQGVFPVRDTGEDGFVGTSPVGSFPANGYGLYDMAGNVWQWCSDWYRVDTNIEAASKNVCRDPSGPTESYDPADPYSPKRVVKGGSFLCNPSYCESYRPSARRGTPPDTGSSHTGFRCVISRSDSQASGSAGSQASLNK